MAKRNEKRKYRWVRTVVLVLLLCRAANWYWYTRGVVPLTNLPVARVAKREAQQVTQTCSTAELREKFFSTDHKFYVRFSPITIRFLGVEAYRDHMEMYEAASGRRLGFYQFKQLRFCGWSTDGSGVYIRDEYPGYSSLWEMGPDWDWLDRDYLGPLKKVLVPCRAPLKGVRLLPRLYWGMRCLFPDPFHPLAVWVPLVVMVLGVGAAIGYGYRLWRTPGVQSRVEKGLERLDRWWQNLKWRLFMRL